MKHLPYESIIAREDLSYRLNLNYMRLECEHYRPDNAYRDMDYSWPADWEGRVILSLVFLARSAKREPAYLNRILDMLDEHLNERGYIGPISKDGVFDEQQFSGHNWMIRGLLEYYVWRKDERLKKILLKMVDNLYLPALGYYINYPIDPEVRIVSGEASGNLTGNVINHWLTSSDIGCAYMCLDALTHIYEVLKYEPARPLIEEMIETFSKINFVKASMQTHATLSGTRGIIRFYRATGDKKYLDMAIRIFDIYQKQGMTENYCNYNWFGRPLWTEPCAIVDSFIVATWLHNETKDDRYLETAQKIYYNGFGFSQRSNGGFGCDMCAGANDAFLYTDKNSYEAYWCCTMRGSEGLAKVLTATGATQEDTLFLFYQRDCLINVDGLTVDMKTLFPMSGKVQIKVTPKSDCKIKKIKIFIPSYLKNSFSNMSINGKISDLVWDNNYIVINVGKDEINVEYSMELTLRVVQPIAENTIAGYHSYWCGPLMLGVETDTEFMNVKVGDKITETSFSFAGDKILKPLTDNIFVDQETTEKRKFQVMFK